MIRIFKRSLQAHVTVETPHDHAIVEWVARHPAWLFCPYSVKAIGRVPDPLAGRSSGSRAAANSALPRWGCLGGVPPGLAIGARGQLGRDGLAPQEHECG